MPQIHGEEMFSQGGFSCGGTAAASGCPGLPLTVVLSWGLGASGEHSFDPYTFGGILGP